MFAIITTIATSLHTARPVPEQTQLPIPPVHWGYDVYGKDQQVDIQGGRSLAACIECIYNIQYTSCYARSIPCLHLVIPRFLGLRHVKMKNKNKNREWIVSHLAIGGDLLRSLCLNLGWGLVFSAFAATIEVQRFLYRVQRLEFH
jgi:hypothetical protein